MEQERGKQKGPWTKKRRILVAALAILAAALLFIAARLLYVMFVDPMQAFGQAMVTPTPVPTAAPTPTDTPALTAVPAPTATPTLSPSPTPTATPTPEPTGTPEPVAGEFMQNRVNVLLVGYDSSPERLDEESEVYRDETNDFRSDVLMLVSFDLYNKTAEMISVPRDSYAPIYKADGTLFAKTGGRYKINAAFAKGGANTKNGYRYAMNTVSHLLGVPIEYYAGVDMTGLKGVVNAMGGVDYDVDVEIRLNGRVLRKGWQHLNGQQVLDYCRARKGISTDVGRNDRQQRMLLAIFEQMQSREQLINFGKIYRSIKQYVNTNLNTEQVMALAAFGATLSSGNITRYTLPGEYHSDTPYSAAGYYVIDNDALVEMMRGIFGITIETNPRYGLDYVLADIAAAAGKEDLKSADYVLALKKVTAAYPKDEETGEYLVLDDALEDVLRYQAALTGKCYRKKGADTSVKLDQAGIEKNRNALQKALSALCRACGVTQKNVKKSRLPEAVYNALPPKEPETDSATG